MKRVVVLITSVMMLFLIIFPNPVYADVVDDSYVGGVNMLYHDMLDDTLTHFGLSSIVLDDTDWYFCAGPYLDGSSNTFGRYQSALWIDNVGYRAVYNGDASVPYTDFFTKSSECAVLSTYIGDVDFSRFLLASQSWSWHYDLFLTDNLDAYNSSVMYGYTDCFLAEASTGSDIASAFEDAVLPDPTDPIEPTTSTSSGDDSDDSGGSGIDLSGIVSGIKDLPGKIGDAFKTVIDNAFSAFQNFLKDLFMPDTDAIQAEWEFIQSKFQFWLDARDFIQEILNSIKSMQGVPPETIEFTLTAPDTVWFKGLSGTAVAIDLSWFASYRSSVHVIASAFIWIVYLWKIFHVLPGIISGASGAVSKVSAEKEGD